MKKKKRKDMPKLEALETEVARLDYRERFISALRTTVYTLITVVAFALLTATLFLPVLQVYGTSMEPNIKEDTMVICSKTGQPKRGDVLAFYYNNKILIRRVIGLPGDVISIDNSGNVNVNHELLQEDYVTEHTLGTCDLQFPYTVPDGEYFVMGDNRGEVVDSRVSTVGCILQEEFIGVVRFKFWPLNEIGFVK